MYFNFNLVPTLGSFTTETIYLVTSIAYFLNLEVLFKSLKSFLWKHFPCDIHHTQCATSRSEAMAVEDAGVKVWDEITHRLVWFGMPSASLVAVELTSSGH